jgi:uncharacterized protein
LLKAQTENKCIVLSIGYSACHWCHVMEHECFEDHEVAAVMNQFFVCIKVDREERPDIDAIYMDACQNMGLRGGWPLNVFLLPNQQAFYGGTYFPKPNWLNVLYSVQQTFETQAEKLYESAASITASLNQNIEERYLKNAENLTLDWSDIKNKLVSSFDFEHGGLQRAPKFPMPAVWSLVKTLCPQEDLETHLIFTLKRMVLGGIFDHIRGGWTRYSTDTRWKVPHFEKMAYDNGQLLSLYASSLSELTWTAEDKKLIKWAIEKTINWLKTELYEPSAGFYAALDADSEGEEGKFYIWKKAEIDSLKAPYLEAFIEAYEISKQGNWEHGNNILHLENIPEKFWDFLPIYEQLLVFQNQRIRPGLDHKIMVNWNSMLLVGLLDVELSAEFPTQKIWITEIIDSLFKQFSQKTGPDSRPALALIHQPISQDLPEGIPGFLDDYAWLIRASIKYYQSYFDESYLQKAQMLVHYVLANFMDLEDSLLYYTDIEAEKLISRKKELFDNVIPSSNALMAHNLYELGRILSDNELSIWAQKMLNQCKALVQRDPVWLSHWTELAFKMQANSLDIYVIGPDYLSVAKALRKYTKNKSLIYATASDSSLKVFEGKELKGTQTKIYVCVNQTCFAPVDSVDAAINLLNYDLA